MIGMAFHRNKAQLRAGLNIEKKQEAVHIPQAFQGKLSLVQLILKYALFKFFSLKEHRLITQQLDGIAQGILQILGHPESMFVGIFIQSVQKGQSVFRNQGVPVEKRGHGFQSGGFPAAENFIQVKAEKAFAVPLCSVNEHQLVQGK